MVKKLRNFFYKNTFLSVIYHAISFAWGRLLPFFDHIEELLTLECGLFLVWKRVLRRHFIQIFSNNVFFCFSIRAFAAMLLKHLGNIFAQVLFYCTQPNTSFSSDLKNCDFTWTRVFPIFQKVKHCKENAFIFLAPDS